MSHRIEISDKTYDRLKEYCELNGFKIGQFADKLLYDGLMIELYGDVPFTDYKKFSREMSYDKETNTLHIKLDNAPDKIETNFVLKDDGTVVLGDEIKEELKKGFKNSIVEGETNYLVNKEGIKAIDKEMKERLIEEMEKVEDANPPTCIAHPELQNEINKEMLRQVGVPDKVVNKITRRRLK